MSYSLWHKNPLYFKIYTTKSNKSSFLPQEFWYIQKVLENQFVSFKKKKKKQVKHNNLVVNDELSYKDKVIFSFIITSPNILIHASNTNRTSGKKVKILW